MNDEIEPRFRADRFIQMMERRNLGSGELEYLAGVSRSQIWYLQRGEKPNVSAVIVGKLALVLGCSMDYLLDLTDNPAPPVDERPPIDFLALWKQFEELSPSGRQELTQIAEVLLRVQEETQPSQDQTYDRLMTLVLDKVEEVGGQAELNDLLAELESLLPGSSARLRQRRAQQQE